MSKRSFRPVALVNTDSCETDQQRLELEQWLEDILVENFDDIFDGKYTFLAKKHPIMQSQDKIGEIDLLAVNNHTNALVVIELKRNQADYNAMGQLLFYMGWLKTHTKEIISKFDALHNGKPHRDVEGIIICGTPDLRLSYAVEGSPNVQLYGYGCDPCTGLFCLGRYIKLRNGKTISLPQLDDAEKDEGYKQLFSPVETQKVQ